MTNIRSTRRDALRNRDTILDAAVARLTVDPGASMSDIAKATGVTRATVYAHFPSREQLVEAVLVRTIERSEAELGRIDLDGEPVAALDRLVRGSWRVVAGFHRLLGAAEEALSNERIMAHHVEPMARVQALIERGQGDGSMRRDLGAEWLTTCVTALLHTAAAALRTGGLAEEDADRVVATTVVSLVTAGTARHPLS